MAGRLAVDFGTSNTRVAVWDAGLGRATSLRIPDVSETDFVADGDQRVEVPFIPSVICFQGGQTWIGRQVREQGRLASNDTFRLMKRYISNRLDLPRTVNGVPVSFPQAGAQFLSRVLAFASPAIDFADEEVAFTVPVDTYEHYQNWLATVCDAAGIRRYRLLDEASAAALGYGVGIRGGDVYMVIDFGGGTLDVSIVRVESQSEGGRRCRVLGKGGAELGGSTIDGWLYQDLLRHTKKSPEDVRRISALLLVEIERVKRELSEKDEAQLAVADPDTGAVIGKRYTRTNLEDLMEDRGLFGVLQGAVDQALAAAREAGFERDHIGQVLLVGGASLIPSVRRALRQLFGDRVRYHRPLDAVALGAAAFVGGADFYDHIQHEYALRFYSREKGDFEFKTVVPACTPYPTKDPVARFTIKASHDDQEFLGLNVFEIGRRSAAAIPEGSLDLVFDASGGARFQQREDAEIRRHFWVNEGCPTFIHAQPEAQKGDPRFPVEFTVDGNKRLCVTVRDNSTGKTLLKDHPVIRLT